MMKLVISKSKDGRGYYTKLIDEYNGQKNEMYMSLQISKKIGELEYGLYNIDGFLSCYASKDGSVKPKLVITNASIISKFGNKSNSEIIADVMTETDPYAEFGESIDITDNMLD